MYSELTREQRKQRIEELNKLYGCDYKTFERKMHPSTRQMPKYQWPADKLTNKEMAILYGWRQKTSTPINHLLRQAIEELNRIIIRGRNGI